MKPSRPLLIFTLTILLVLLTIIVVHGDDTGQYQHLDQNSPNSQNSQNSQPNSQNSQNSQNGLLTLTLENYKQHLSRPTLVLFTSTGCAKCDLTHAEFDEANQLLQKDQDSALLASGNRTPSDTRFGVINCTEPDQAPICREYKIESFPTILAVHFPRYFEEFKASGQHGARVATSIYRFYRSSFHTQIFPSLSTKSQYEQYTTQDLGPDFLKTVLKMPPHAFMNGDQFEPYRHLRIRLYDKMITMAHDLQHSGAFALYNTTTELGLDGLAHRLTLSAPTPTDSLYINSQLSLVTDDSFWLEIWRDFDESPVMFEIRSSLDIEKVENWWASKLVPLFGPISAANYNNYLSRQLPLVWVFYDRTNKGSLLTQKINTMFLDLAEKFNDFLLFISVDAAKFGPHARNFGIMTPPRPSSGSPAPLPIGYVIEDRFQRKNYVFETGENGNGDEAFTDLDRIEKWLQNYLKNDQNYQKNSKSDQNGQNSAQPNTQIPSPSPTPTLRSQPVSQHRDETKTGGIHTVVGSHFKEYLKEQVLAQKNDVAIMFYTSWCSVSPHLRAIFNDLLVDERDQEQDQDKEQDQDDQENDKGKAKTKTKANTVQELIAKADEGKLKLFNRNLGQKVVFAQFDISSNDLPSSPLALSTSQSISVPLITETPALYMFQAGGAEPVRYQGNIGYVEVFEWLRKFSSTTSTANSDPKSTQIKDTSAGASKNGHKHDEL